mmetsp:Transcript_69278/g.166124  ORF Transcript_69278/g.166124 Transcript_69278/m.166124 type:complete len:365 (+) Transcript_69278:83-1177(+)
MGTPTIEPESNPMQVAIAVCAYMLCSSLALVANKVVMTYFQAPGLVFFLQLLSTLAFISLLSGMRWISVDKVTLQNTRVFLPYIAGFVMCLYTNGKALSVSNMETLIVFRACSPLCVSVLDFVFLGREFPSLRSLAALFGVIFGAVMYMQADGEFAMHGITAYNWALLNLISIVFEMVYAKALISNIAFENPVWGATLYTNLLSLAPMAVVSLATAEYKHVSLDGVGRAGFFWFFVSCVVGTGISWAGWNCRNQTSAALYTLLGVVCKFLSVLINVLIWDKHASNNGLLALAVCLVSSSLYRQAPKRVENSPVASGAAPRTWTKESENSTVCSRSSSKSRAREDDEDEEQPLCSGTTVGNSSED